VAIPTQLTAYLFELTPVNVRYGVRQLREADDGFWPNPAGTLIRKPLKAPY